MKLLFCEKCQDVFKIGKEERSCKCGITSGKYLDDGYHAEISGEFAVPIGFSNHSLAVA